MKKYFSFIATTLGVWLTLSAFTIGTPFRSAKILNTLPPDTILVVGITHVTLGDDSKKNDIFWKHTNNVLESLPNHNGYLGHKVRKQLFGNEAWTMTVWKDEASLKEFVTSEIHNNAIKHGLDAVAKARFVRFTTEQFKIPPSWTEAEKIMNKEGRDLYGNK